MYIMNLAVSIYSAILFFILTPGIILRLPSNGSKMMVAGVHAILFCIILLLTGPIIWRLSASMSEGFSEGPASNKKKVNTLDIKKKAGERKKPQHMAK